MTTQKDRIEAAIRHIQTAVDIDPWAMELAVDALKAQGTCDDAVSRQTLQKELALYPIDDVTSEDEAGYNRAINDVQKMVLHLPSAQPEKAQLSGENATFDCISRQTVIDAIDDIESEVADGDGFQYAKWREYFCELPSVQPEQPEHEELDFVQPHKKIGVRLEIGQPEIIRCKDCKFYTPMNRETKTGICRLLMHQNFGDDWYCAGAERRTDCVRAFTDMYEEERDD